MSDNQQQRAPLKLNIFDVMSNWLFADPVPGSSRRPNLRVKVLGNVPRITVKTNVDGDKNNGKIDFQTDLPTFAVALHRLREMAEGRDTSEGYNFDYEDDFLNGKKLDKKIIISSLQIGRAEDGRLYIAVLSGDKSRPRIQFFFGPSKYHNIRRRDGSALTAAELSSNYAIGFLEPASKMVSQLLIDNFDENAKNVAKPPVQGGQGGGGYNGGGNRNYNGGGNNNYQRRDNQAGGASTYNGGGSGQVETFDDNFDF